MTRRTLFPVTRVHEPMGIEVEIEGGRVVDAWVFATLFRGFEPIMIGRDPRDASLFIQRVCGICSSAHAVAAAYAQQQAFQVEPTPNGQLITNLIFAADILQNHLRHFYALSLPDYAVTPDIPPFTPRIKGDYRLPKKVNDDMVRHLLDSIRVSARAHEMLAIFGAKAPHQQTILATGVTEQASSPNIMAYGAILQDIKEFVEKVYLPDALALGDYYKDYYAIGAGAGNFLSYGLFPQPVTGQQSFAPGLIVGKGPLQSLDASRITESVRCSRYRDDNDIRPPTDGRTDPDADKSGAYSWVKAPRYQGAAFEGGPLARGWINGFWRRGISVMDRHIARARESLEICRLAEEWLAQLVPGGPNHRPFTPPPQGSGAGLTDAMRGALGHWFSYRNGKIDHYQIITPSTWNFSPRDEAGRRGPVEEALLGTPVTDPETLIEVGRVVRSYDPCISCAVHALKPKEPLP